MQCEGVESKSITHINFIIIVCTCLDARLLYARMRNVWEIWTSRTVLAGNPRAFEVEHGGESLCERASVCSAVS